MFLTTLSLLASGCSMRPAAQSARPFSVSSESSGFVVRGSLSGMVSWTSSTMTVVVDSGHVLSDSNESDVTLQAMVAGAGPRDARRVAEGNTHSLGAFAKGSARDIVTPFTLTVPIYDDFDPAAQWLVFKFGQATGTFDYVCETTNLAEPKDAAPRRPGFVCWANPQR